MLPRTFEHCRSATSSEKLTCKWFGCVPYLLSILSKHRFIVNRQRYDQVGFHLTLPLLRTMHLDVFIGAAPCAPAAQPQPAAGVELRKISIFSASHCGSVRGGLPVISSTVDVVSPSADSRKIWSSPTSKSATNGERPSANSVARCSSIDRSL